ncbi:LIM domain protein [Dictyocaulus viviparus]|uniref:LIM domain protein n=1 Tax=Dictyocaulus viviparus TaxID=29172 RepID=A0A0D8XJS7_DICVI|nr:LIM domain protein [Dictyocaulus viviparus]
MRTFEFHDFTFSLYSVNNALKPKGEHGIIIIFNVPIARRNWVGKNICKDDFRNRKPVCLGCFHSNGSSSLTCTTCNGTIPHDTPHISQGEMTWHADKRCFCCSVCAKNLLGKKYTLVDKSLYCGYKTCGGEEELFIDDHIATCSTPSRIQANVSNNRDRKFVSREKKILETPIRLSPASYTAPRPPQRAPPSPPAENIYETVLPSTAQRTEHRTRNGIEGQNHYSRTPNKSRRRDEQGYCLTTSSTSSSDSEDDAFYMSKLFVASSLNQKHHRGLPPLSNVKIAKTKKSNRCLLS